jgi:hypothetical protein
MASAEQNRHPARVVAIGGGTGLSTLLKGLKKYTVRATDVPPEGQFISDLTAVVTVSDDGGSSGRLRRELGMLPAMFATAWLRSQKMRACSPSCFSIASPVRATWKAITSAIYFWRRSPP